MAARGIVKTHVRVETMDKLTEVFNEMSKGTSKDPPPSFPRKRVLTSTVQCKEEWFLISTEEGRQRR